MDEVFFQELRKKVKPYFIEGGSHAFDHVERVYNLALKLANTEKNVDLDVLKAAVLLHDVARQKEDKKECECHAEEGAKMAEKILNEMNFQEDKIKKASYAIYVHRHSKGMKAETKEAEILQDADRLDALGAITIGRMFSSGGELNRPLYNPSVPLGDKSAKFETSTLHGFYTKIFKIKPECFNTDEAKKIAKGRYKFVEEFVDRFLKEWNGEL
ncbi:MAG: HD domain-containing protein [Nanoarchaeota archaeon]